MKPTKVIRTNGALINPFTPELAQLVQWSYTAAKFSEQHAARDKSRPSGGDETCYQYDHWGGRHFWYAEHRAWENIQFSIFNRDIDSRDPIPDAARRSVDGRQLIAIIIPGTNEAGDWVKGNLVPWPMRIAGLPGLWRRGFHVGAEWIWSQVHDLVDHGHVLMIAGHSFGGSMAITLGGFIERDKHEDDVIALLGFAATRVTTKEGAERMDLEYRWKQIGQRYTLGFDMVPWSVPSFVGWRHCLDPIFIGADHHVRHRYYFWRELKAAVRHRGIDAIRAHAMARYLEWAQSLPRPVER